jgi:hypothetical protein
MTSEIQPADDAVVESAKAGPGPAQLLGVVETVGGADVGERLLEHVHHRWTGSCGTAKTEMALSKRRGGCVVGPVFDRFRTDRFIKYENCGKN